MHLNAHTKERFLTSSHYNETKFYMLNAEYLETLTDAMVDEIAAEYNKTHAKEKQSVEETWECAFLEWSGTRKHPKATEVVEQGIVRGQWFYRKDGTKKKTSANGFRFIKRV